MTAKKGQKFKHYPSYSSTYPAGPAHYCWISYKADNLPAKKLYESFGFRDNGEIFGDELITVLTL